MSVNNFPGSSDTSTGVVVGTGSAGILQFTGVSPTSHEGETGTGFSAGTFTFKIDNNGNVYNIVVASGGAYVDGTSATFDAADLNTANSSYDTARGDLTIFIDTNGTPSTSTDATTTFSGTATTIVDSQANILNENAVTLNGLIPTSTTGDFTIFVRGYLARGAGALVTAVSNLNTSSGVEILFTDTEI